MAQFDSANANLQQHMEKKAIEKAEIEKTSVQLDKFIQEREKEILRLQVWSSYLQVWSYKKKR